MFYLNRKQNIEKKRNKTLWKPVIDPTLKEFETIYRKKKVFIIRLGILSIIIMSTRKAVKLNRFR